MDSGKDLAPSVKIEKLDESNFHIWKQKIDLILAYREVDHVVSETNPHVDGSPEHSKWKQSDKVARAVIGLSLSDEMLNHVRGVTTAKDMLESIVNVFQRHTLLNKLRARREFYTATMHTGEKMLTYINRVCHLSTILKSMNVQIENEEVVMAVLNGLPKQYDNIITALDALGSESTFSLEFVKSRLLQEEQRNNIRGAASGETALVQRPRPPPRQTLKCTHCGRKGHTESRCWDKYPEQRPKRPSGAGRPSALTVEEGNNDQDEDVVCLTARYVSNKTHKWIVDSGASAHMTSDRDLFCSYECVNPFSVQIGDKPRLEVPGKGNIAVSIGPDNSSKSFLLQDVLYVPDLKYSLLSVGVLVDRGYLVTFNESGVHVRKNGNVVLRGPKERGIFSITTTPRTHDHGTACVADLDVWHQRFGHVNAQCVLQMSRLNVVNGLSLSNKSFSRCEACIKGKQSRVEIPKQSKSGAKYSVLDLVVSDVCGPIEVESLGRSKYFITFTDVGSRYVVAYPIRAKSDAFDRFKTYLAMIERHTGKKLKAFHNDGGGEYISDEFQDFLRLKGIRFRNTCTDTPQQNGIAERLNRTLVNMIRSMLSHASLPKTFWAEALVTAVYIRNRVTCRALGPRTRPYEVWNGRKPDVSHLRVFGSMCWYSSHGKSRKKLDERAKVAVMIGYAENKVAYKLWDPESRKVLASRDVVFAEDREANSANEDKGLSDSQAEVDLSTPSDDNVGPVTSPGNENEEQSTFEPAESHTESPSLEVPSEELTSQPSEEQPEEQTIRRSTRTRRPPGIWWRSGSTALATLSEDDIPDQFLTYAHATKGENRSKWIEAIDSEMESLRKNETWTLVPRQQARNILTCRWLFKRKDAVSESGASVIKHKARLVTRGFQQVYKVDYELTFAPVVKLTTLRMLLAIVAAEDLELHQMDVKTAFLYGELEEDIFMEQPEGFVDEKYPDHVCKLQKALYGLKQAPRRWYAKIHTFLSELGFQSCAYDPCFYVKRSKDGVLLISLYVDDLLIGGTHLEDVVWLKGEMCKRFEMKDCGEAQVCLGLEISRQRAEKVLNLGQSRYAEKVLARFGMANCKPVSTPMDVQVDSSMLNTDECDPTLYRQAIGSLMYLMIGSRPDIAFAVGRLSQYMEKPTTALWTCVKRIMRYIRGTSNFVIAFNGVSHPNADITGYTDSDYAGCEVTRKSTTGIVFLMTGGAISWFSKKQTIVATSSAEAEYIALGKGAQEAVWLSRILAHAFGKGEEPILVNVDNEQSILVNVDNQGSIKMAQNDASSSRTKHIDIRYHLVRDLLQKKKFSITYCPTQNMIADALTKPLQRVAFEKFRNALGLQASL